MLSAIDPDRIAIVAGDERITYGALAERAARVATLIPEGARVTCAFRNRPAFLEVVFGAALARAEVIPVPWRASADEHAYYASDSGASVSFGDVDHPGEAAYRIDSTYPSAVAAARPLPTPDDVRPPLLRFYTSGTTGRPKAVERARPDPATYAETVRNALDRFEVASPDEVHLVCGPLYHAAPLAYAAYALMTGQTVVLPQRFDAETTLRLIAAEKVTWSIMVPVHFIRLLALPSETLARADLSSVKRIVHMAAPCPPDVKRRIMQLFPGAVWEMYGMTEGRGTLITAEEWERVPGSVGRPYPGVTITIRDEFGRALGPGEVGTVYLHDTSTFEYAGAPDKTASARIGDSYTVGDMGYLDADGYLFLTDRAVDVIITGGSNVYPAEVEAALHRHPAVVDCAVIGIPDDEWGERVMAIVETAGAQPKPSELLEHCRRYLADYKCPRAFIFVDRLPRDEAGKVRKRDLRAPHWAGRARSI